MNGSDVLGKVKSVMPEVPFIIITGYSDVKTAVDVMKMGAYDYVTKPLFPDEILVTIKQALSDPSDVDHDDLEQRPEVRRQRFPHVALNPYPMRPQQPIRPCSSGA
jgi:two-component system response regulator HydG